MTSPKRWLGGLFPLLLLAGGCAPRLRPTTASSPSPATPPPLACREVEGLEPLLVPGSALLLGEIHGTVESPAFLANAVCLALRAGHSVTVALEVPREEQGRVDAFLASAGAASDRAAFLASPFWTAEYQDGRQSVAMLALFDELRRLHREGRPIRLKLIDRTEKPPASGARDRWMAEAWADALDETPGAVLISLTGDVHSRIRIGTPWDPAYPTAGSVLAGLKPDLRLTALDVGSTGGTAWTCLTTVAAECKANSLRGRGDATPGKVVLHPEVTEGHNGTYGVGAFTASPPAVRSQEVSPPPAADGHPPR